MVWQILSDGPSLAKENMEADEKLLFHVQRPTIKIHSWQKPAFTYGYFVKPEEEFYSSKAFDIARRCTGGGIIFHKEDLSFALVVPPTHPFYLLEQFDCYRVINQKILEALQPFVDRPIELEPIFAYEPKTPFCMAKPTKYDLVVEGKKLLGAAIRKRKSGLLYHGSISLKMPDRLFLLEALKRGEVLVEKILSSTYPLSVDKETVLKRVIEYVAKS